MKNLTAIPIVLCFNDNYVIPAAVAIYSILLNSSKKYIYDIYILHSDITCEHRKGLIENIKDFSNVSLTFIDMKDKFSNLFNETVSQAHWSKEIYYKFLPAEIFPAYDKIIITDADVIFLDDISELYENFDINDDYYLAASIQIYHKKLYEASLSILRKHFSNEEINKLCFSGGLYIFNLKKMREDGIVQKFIDYAQKNKHRLICPEQEVINLVCHPKIKKLPVNSLVCPKTYDEFKEHDYENALLYSISEVKYALASPIQLHYGSHIKPWNVPTMTKAHIWYSYLAKTIFYKEQMHKFMLKPKNTKLFSMKIFKKKIICFIENY